MVEVVKAAKKLEPPVDQEVGVKVDLLLHLVIVEEQEILQLLRLLKELQVEKVMMV